MDGCVCLSTDDSSVFGTTASAELARVALELGLDAPHVVALATRALDDAFEPCAAARAELAERFAREAAVALAAYESTRSSFEK